MISVISRRKELRLRQTILRGVYEDNLRIIGKAPKTISGKIPFSLKKTFLFLLIMLLAILVNGNYIDLSLFQERQVTANLTDQKPFLLPAQDPVNPSTYKSSFSIPEQESFLLPPEDPVSLSDYKAFISAPRIPLSRTFGLQVKTIMIDPGHGGSATGTIGKMGTKEKDITLDIAKRLRDRLKKYGKYNVLMTRENDISMPLNDRVELARLSKADLFISIHVNYLPSKPINIIETYYFGPTSDDKTLKLAEIENSGSQYGLSDFKEIIEKIGDTLKFQESRSLAASIQENLFLNIKKQDRGVKNYGLKRAPFLVLLGVDVPAVLTEVSCLSNREAEIELNTESHRENIAYYLEAGILDYLNKGEVSYEAKRR
jgi:N-acetylmuramoyl-L-alanine amidase